MNPLEPLILKAGAIALILGATWIHGCHHGESQVKAEYLQYKSQVEAAGRSAQAAADAQKKLDEQKAKASDESYSKALSVLGSDIERLRRARSSTNYLPAKPADTKCPEGWACFDRALLEQALQRLDDGVSGIVAEGDQIRLKLTTAVEWAKGN